MTRIFFSVVCIFLVAVAGVTVDDLKDTLAAELIPFAAFVCTEKPVTANETVELTTYKLLSSLSLNLSQTFLNR